MEIKIPRDRKGKFEPMIVPKHSRDISNIEQQIINLYSMGTSTREISSYVEEMYGFSVSTEMVSNITDKIIPEMEEWKTRRLEEVLISSIRGSGYEKEDRLYNIQNEKMYKEIIKLIKDTSQNKEIIETCGHAILQLNHF